LLRPQKKEEIMSVTTIERPDGGSFQIVSIGFDPSNRTCSVERSLVATALWVAADDAARGDILGRISDWMLDHDLDHPTVLGLDRIRTHEKTRGIYLRAREKMAAGNAFRN